MPIYSKVNDWGGQSISELCHQYLLDHLKPGKTILELGSGWATAKLAETWNVWSIEDDPKWFKKYHDQAFLVPLKDGWYGRDTLKECLSGLAYDALLIDGPYDDRAGLLDNLDLFDTSVHMVFDDVRREEGRAIIEEVAERVDRPCFVVGEGRSMFGAIL